MATYLRSGLTLPVRARLANQIQILLVKLGFLLALGPPPLLSAFAFAPRFVAAVFLFLFALVDNEALADLRTVKSSAGYKKKQKRSTCSARCCPVYLCRLLLVIIVILLLARILDAGLPFSSPRSAIAVVFPLLAIKGFIVLLGTELGLALDKVGAFAHRGDREKGGCGKGRQRGLSGHSWG